MNACSYEKLYFVFYGNVHLKGNMDENIKPFQLIDKINYQLSRDAHAMKWILELVFLLLMHKYLLLSNAPAGDSHFINLHALNS